MLCGGACTDADSDAANCGACGNVCSLFCSGGACRTVSSVYRGSEWTCALMSDGTVRCWGRNDYGQLGDGTTTSRATPAAVPGLSNVTEVAVGRGFTTVTGHTCARLADSTVRCWGYNSHGQIGDGTTTNRPTPYDPGVAGVVHVAVGQTHTCALINDGTVRCWGANESGHLGNGGTAPTAMPTSVVGLTNATQLSLTGLTSCARSSDGRVRCWGSNVSYALGYYGAGRPYPVDLGLSDVAEVHMGSSHVCARIATGGTVACWGFNSQGQLGDGTLSDRPSPTGGGGIVGAVQLSVGGTATAVRLADGTVYRWGAGWNGDGTAPTASAIAIALPGVSDATQISTGFDGMCIRRSSSAGAMCWGQNKYGAVGDGTVVEKRVLTPVKF